MISTVSWRPQYVTFEPSRQETGAVLARLLLSPVFRGVRRGQVCRGPPRENSGRRRQRAGRAQYPAKGSYCTAVSPMSITSNAMAGHTIGFRYLERGQNPPPAPTSTSEPLLCVCLFDNQGTCLLDRAKVFTIPPLLVQTISLGSRVVALNCCWKNLENIHKSRKRAADKSTMLHDGKRGRLSSPEMLQFGSYSGIGR